MRAFGLSACVALLVISGGRDTGAQVPKAPKEITIASPDGGLVVTVAPGRTGDASQWRYRLDAVDGKVRRERLGWSPLGLTLDDGAFTAMRLAGTSEARTVRERYTTPHGKRMQRLHEARERDIDFASASGGRVRLTMRVARDGIAFRYTVLGESAQPRRLRDEATGFAVPRGSRAWLLPHQLPGRWAPAYEDFFMEVDAGTAAPTEQGWSYPALFRLPDGVSWLLVSEAGVDRTHAATRLAAEAPEGVYRLRLPDPAEGLGQGGVQPEAPTPWTMPWRVVITGTLADVVASTLVEDVSPPATADFSWVRPGRASFGWWIDDDASKKEDVLKAFVDLSATMGWEYSLIDANWHLAPEGTLERVVAHAREKGVRLFLWYNSAGPHNDVTEWGPRDRLFEPAARRAEFAKLAAMGIAGVKVDFWHSDKPSVVALYHDVLRDAADAGLHVVLHGATAPRGWSRTYPNLLSAEAVLAAEQYKYSERFAREAAWHNAVLPFTRNVIGPMDYTPVTLSDAKFPHLTTNAHELALAVVFESGIVHFADSPKAYGDLPPAAIDLLKAVPVAWDETRLLDGDPGRLAVIARRSGDEWWVGAINGTAKTQTAAVDLAFLGEGQWELTMVRDGGAPRHLASEAAAVRAVDRFNVPMLARGGFLMRFVRRPS